MTIKHKNWLGLGEKSRVKKDWLSLKRIVILVSIKCANSHLLFWKENVYFWWKNFTEQEKVTIFNLFTDLTYAVRSGSQMSPVRCGPVHRFYRCGPVRFTDVTGAVRSGSRILPVRSGPVHRFSRFGSVRFSLTNGTFFLRSERWPPLINGHYFFVILFVYHSFKQEIF